jgi:hypothetical protein
LPDLLSKNKLIPLSSLIYYISKLTFKTCFQNEKNTRGRISCHGDL